MTFAKMSLIIMCNIQPSQTLVVRLGRPLTDEYDFENGVYCHNMLYL